MNKNDISRVIKSIGLVFGDIGTSPIYTVTVIFILLEKTLMNIMGIMSLIFWTITVLVTIEYAWLAMSLGTKGEGGEIVLKETLTPLLKSARKISFITILTYIGISLVIGDGIITPAISILSAVEGIRLIPGMENLNQIIVIIISSIIAIALFSFQKKGVERVTSAFGPIMVLWFFTLTVSGILSIFSHPEILKAINPYYAYKFLVSNGLVSFIVLSEVILCCTGGEALFADMGHLGKKPILQAWSVVFFALAFCYFGQGAFLAHHPNAQNVLFEMFYSQFHYLYIPFLILSVLATIIASQAMISAIFSIVYQGINTRILPMFKVDYTSEELRAQIYIASVNWFLLLFVLIVMFHFQKSSNLAAAYGLAVTGSMTISGIMMSCIFYLKKYYLKFSIAIFVVLTDIIFLTANMFKIPHGGYWSIIIALIPFIVILIYTSGQKRLYSKLHPVPLDKFLIKFDELYQNASKIEGTALFFIRDISRIPPYIFNTICSNHIIYNDNLLVAINILDEPFGINSFFKEDITQGLRNFEIRAGYMEVVDLEKILHQAGIQDKVIFYGMEEIMSDSLVWKIFTLIKKVTPSFVQFYSIPSRKLHGVVTRVNI